MSPVSKPASRQLSRVWVCAVEPGLRGQTQRRNFEIQKYMATQLGMRETEARRRPVAARLDVVHVLQKRHQRSFRGISTGDHFLVL